MTAPAHSGGEGHLCRGSGVITQDSAGGEGPRGVVKGTEKHVVFFCGWGVGRECAIHLQTQMLCNQKSPSLVLIDLTC